MGTFRGFCSSIGAATSLVVAGVLVLLAASSVVAFNGWPGVRDWPEATPVAVSDVTTTASRPTRVGAVRLGSAARGRPSATAARSSGSGPASRGATAGREDAASSRGRPIARTGIPRRAGARAVPAGGATPTATARTTKPSTADEVAQTVDGVTAPTRREPLRLRVPHVREVPALDPVVDTLNNVLDQTTGALKQLLAGTQAP